MNRDTIPPDVKKEEQQNVLQEKSPWQTFSVHANAPKEDSEQLDEFLGPQAGKMLRLF